MSISRPHVDLHVRALSVPTRPTPVLWRLPGGAEGKQGGGAAAARRLAYREHGEGLFDHLAGAFALAILDSANRRALLAVDRMGVHGLYYAQPPGAGLVFGRSEEHI